MALDSRIRSRYYGRVWMAQTEAGSPHTLIVDEIVVGARLGQETLVQYTISHLETRIAVVERMPNTMASLSFLRKTSWKNTSDEAPAAGRRSSGILSARGKGAGIPAYLLLEVLLCVSLEACCPSTAVLGGRHYLEDPVQRSFGTEEQSLTEESPRRQYPGIVEGLPACDVGIRVLDGLEAEK